MQQGAYTLCTAINPEAIEDLKAVLAEINRDVARNDVVPFKKMNDTHFARFVILEETTDEKGRSIRPSLVFSSNFDGSMENHLKLLAELAGEGLDQICCFCEGYPDKSKRTPESRLNYLRSHQVAVPAFYINTIGRTLQQVNLDEQLHEAIEKFLDQKNWSDYSAEKVRSAIQEFVANDASLNWATPSATRAKSFWSVGEILKFALILITLIILLPVLVPLLLIGLVILRIKEKQDNRKNDFVIEPLRRGPEIVNREDYAVQNQFSAVGFVKPGWFRYLTLKVVMSGLNFAAHFIYNNGKLTVVDTIHFFRLVTLDQNRRVLFLSNYDGSLESYMDDFINKVAWGLNAAFSNGVGYPKTNWLIKDGAKDEQAFKAFINQRQIVTQVWYTAYPGLSAVNLRNSAKIREGLWSKMRANDVEKWLQRF